MEANIHESLREDEVEDWQSQRKRGEILCQSEMSDMRLSSLTWHVLERPWLSADNEGRDGKKDSKDGVWKKTGSVALLSLTTQFS